MKDLSEIRRDFKVLNLEKSKPVVYFDSACMSLKPDCVVEVMDEYYEKYPVCAGRSSHRMATIVSKKIYSEAKKVISEFINAKSENEIIFTRNTTEGINLLANSFGFQKGDVVLVSDKEHNSNLIPWLYLRDKIGIEVRICESKEDNTFDLEKFSELVKGVKLVSVVYTSNLDGVTNPVKEIIKIAHNASALVCLDASQASAHEEIDVRDLDVDFLAFSGHKVFGPTGTGVFYGKLDLLEKLNAFMVGGDTVEFSTYDSYKFLPVPEKFEAGLQDYAGIIGLIEALKYAKNIGFKYIKQHELELNKYITEELSKFEKIKIIGPKDPSLRGSIVNFYIEDTDMHKFANMLDNMANIAIRAGQHCVHSWFNAKKIRNSARISFGVFNTKEEAKFLVENIKKIMQII
jgi:cysteine desulfurase/selenocysteine lyase